MYGEKWILTVVTMTIMLEGRADAFTNQWAAHIVGGPDAAQQVAREHGFSQAYKVPRTLSFPLGRFDPARLSSSDVNLSFGYNNAASNNRTYLKTDAKNIGIIIVFPNGRRTSPPLSSVKSKVTSLELPHQKQSSLFEPLRLKRSNDQSPGNNLNPISIRFRHFSIFPNPFNREKGRGIENEEINCFDPIYSNEIDETKDNVEKKIEKPKSEPSMNRPSSVDEQKKRLAQIGEPQRFLRDSRLQKETRPCRAEAIPSIRNEPENSEWPRDPSERRRMMVRPHPPRETRMQDKSMEESARKPREPPRPPPPKCKQSRTSPVAESLKSTPSRWSSVTPLNVESTRNKLGEASKSPSDLVRNTPHMDNWLGTGTPGISRYNLASAANKYQTLFSCALEMEQRWTPRTRRSFTNGSSNFSKMEQHCNDVEIQTKLKLSRKGESSIEKITSCVATSNSTNEVIVPKAKGSSGHESNNPQPTLTANGRCCFPMMNSKGSVSVADLSDQSPNVSALKYLLSKCPCISDMWSSCEKLPAVPPDPLPKPKPQPRFQKLNARFIVVKPAFSETGNWRKQRYSLRQRIYKCPQWKRSPNTEDGELNPRPALIEDSVRCIESWKPDETVSRRIAEPGQRCTGKPEKPRNTKNYQMKMQESREKARKIIFDDWYHMEHRSVVKRSTEPHLDVHRRLTRDSRVRRAIQQRAKSRQKRDLVVKRPSSTQIIIDDERWPQMWYLNRGKGLDMNVLGAWSEGITGSGIVVTILDDGLEKNHPDLYGNYDPQASYDVNGHDDDPMPRYDIVDSNRHGTRCAGEVAATANNSICAVGVAYGAGVGGVRMLDGDVTDAVEARSLSLNPHHIDIYSASWGPDDDGKTVDGPGELATRAFIEGITKGRKGKGSIFVWASGNGGRDHDNCNCDGYTNSIWTLSISSATENGLVPWYSEACSSTLATTYSSGSTGEKQVVTTDLHHHCTSSHTGTSASAPLAAGICALALEANRDLTWRDMQHIVVRTAKPANLKAPDWVTNGVGRNVSHSFGYGLMDATAMVHLAKKWRTVPEQHKCEVSAPHSGRQIPSRSQLVLELHVKECTGVNFLEHVQAKVSLMASRRGDLQIQLTSPQGTKSTLLAKRPHDISKAGFNQWPFMSVHTWGERPHGTWKLEIHNEGRYLGRATLHEWALIFYGTSTLPDRTEYALYSPAGINPPRKPFMKTRESKNALLNVFGTKTKQNQHGNKSPKLTANVGAVGMSQGYSTNSQSQSPKKSKARGQHKNGKSANRGNIRPTVQTLRGLTYMIATSKPRTRSTPRPVVGTSTTRTITSTPRGSDILTKPPRPRIADAVTVSSLQRGLILMEPAPAKAATNKVPVVFQQYPKIQQLYPLYPVYAGARGAGPEHPAKPKGVDLLQDQQFDNRNLHLPDKDTLDEWKMVFYGTETSLEIDEDLDRDKPAPSPADPEVIQDNTAVFDSHSKVVDTEGDPWTGSQQVDLISHPEVQRTTTENQTSGGCTSYNSHGCLECNVGWYLFRGRCVSQCPSETYPAHDEHRSVCSLCHYTCTSCSGPSNTECTSCHGDASLDSSYNGETQCIPKSLEWKTQSTKWFYRMTILFGINLTFLTAAVVYLFLSGVLKKRNAHSEKLYDYNRLASSVENDGPTEKHLLHRNGCLSDSD